MTCRLLYSTGAIDSRRSFASAPSAYCSRCVLRCFLYRSFLTHSIHGQPVQQRVVPSCAPAGKRVRIFSPSPPTSALDHRVTTPIKTPRPVPSLPPSWCATVPLPPVRQKPHAAHTMLASWRGCDAMGTAGREHDAVVVVHGLQPPRGRGARKR